ncbi:MerR family transcriptional regulator [Flavobacterium cellulosilyticum]|uniref:MerR family transcriptional regulator n=1 Tax=Flavobacterium cellulosilyticum TaxID=2541731 RepID=A0A4R5CEH9_9FLAO|nr:MerR family transcriptional regulator [Flavobacterium cellulosilyticum]TDD97326.1 MerR family transcriptional regulator [Flavobacterium cellulosilyticum]
MNNIKTVFSIKDLENLSGIKAHTIRIWEKRYNILEPLRTETNIRTYDSINLQKLLNVVLLNNYGYKISRIAEFPVDKISLIVREIVSEKNANNHALNTFKLAMVNFDQNLFVTTYNSLLSEKTFREVFYEVFIPLMNEIGLLWQSSTISPAQEHFISFLIKQKLLINTEKVQMLELTKTDKVFVLYLPENEIHELGLMYLNYEILLHGYKSVYLGESVPLESLMDMKKHFDNIVYISYLTVKPTKDEIEDYIKDVSDSIIVGNAKIWFIGKMTEFIDTENLSSNISVFSSISDLVCEL